MPPQPADEKPRPDEPARTFSFALRFNGRKRMQQGDDLVARIAAERLIVYLEQSGSMVMKKRPAAAPSGPIATMGHAERAPCIITLLTRALCACYMVWLWSTP